MRRRILFLTTSRADYGFLCPLLDVLRDDAQIDSRLAVCGTHLSGEFGATITEIEADARRVAARFDTVLPEGEPIAYSIALATRGFADAINRLRPDLVFLPGDRYEILGAASAALLAKVPIVHYGGGQCTEGAWDDAVRNAVSKMAHVHFTATETYRNRLLQMGENPAHVFVSGSLGLDNILSIVPWSRERLESDLGFEFGIHSALITFHPATLDVDPPERQLMQLFQALDDFPSLRLLFTQPNVDEGGWELTRLIRDFVDARPGRAILVPSLGRVRYISALKVVDVVVGNSSSGIIEAPSTGIATVNIGDRQLGRIRADSVLDCPPEKEAISLALRRALDSGFRASLAGTKNPYGDGHAARRIHQVLRTIPLANLLRKHFFDIDS